MEYAVVVSIGSLEAFVRDVNEHIADGWRIQGGISVVVINDKACYFQAMYRKGELLPVTVRSGWMATKKA